MQTLILAMAALVETEVPQAPTVSRVARALEPMAATVAVALLLDVVRRQPAVLVARAVRLVRPVPQVPTT